MLAVPSAIVPAESNYLLNPAHPDFKRIKIGKLSTVETDPRYQDLRTQRTGYLAAASIIGSEGLSLMGLSGAVPKNVPTPFCMPLHCAASTAMARLRGHRKQLVMQ